MNDKQHEDMINGFNVIIKGLNSIIGTLGFIALLVLIMTLKVCSM